jgi:hypothetical protein
MSYRVIKPMVIGKDQGGHNRNYYYGSVIPWLSEAQAKHLLSHGLVEKIAEGHHHKPEVHVEPAAVVEHHHGKPAKTAPVGAWVDYAVSQGLSEDEAKGKSKQELIEALG